MVYKVKGKTPEEEYGKDIKNLLDWLCADMRTLANLVDAANLDIELINATDEVVSKMEILEPKLREAC